MISRSNSWNSPFVDASSPGPVSEQHGRLEHPLQAVVLKEGLRTQHPLQAEVVGAPVFHNFFLKKLIVVTYPQKI